MFNTTLSKCRLIFATKRRSRDLTAIITVIFLNFLGYAHAADPYPLLDISDVIYQGGFRVPADDFGSSSANFSYGAIGYNKDNHSMFIAGHEYNRAVAEFPVPELVNSRVLSDLNMAGNPIQNFTNILDKASYDHHGNGVVINGLYYENGRLMVNNYSFYDQSPFHSTNTLILRDASNMKSSAVDGYFTMQGRSYAAGWISPIPEVWQASLGGTHMGGFTSSTARAIIYSSSVGPAAYSFNASDALSNSASISEIPSTELLKYTLENGLVDSDEDLYNKDGTNKVWTHASEGSFGMVVPGTRTYMVLGMSGGHESGMSYGNPPYGGYKGHYTNDEFDKHPYFWLYDIDDFMKVRRGEMNSYEVLPYSVGPFDAPFQVEAVNQISGGSFDTETQTLYLSIFQADTEQGAGTNPPVIVAYKFEVSGSFVDASPPTPPLNPTKVID